MADEFAPRFREHVADAGEKPVDLGLTAEKNAAQNQCHGALRVMLRVGQCQCGAPRTAEHHPALDAQVLAQGFDVLDQVRRGVVAQFAERGGASCTALVKNDDAIENRIEKLPVRGGSTRSWATVQKNHRHALRVARLLEIHRVNRVECQCAGLKGLNGGVEVAGLLGIEAAIGDNVHGISIVK